MFFRKLNFSNIIDFIQYWLETIVFIAIAVKNLVSYYAVKDFYELHTLDENINKYFFYTLLFLNCLFHLLLFFFASYRVDSIKEVVDIVFLKKS